MASMGYLARCKDAASARARFPAPTIAIAGFLLMPGRIAEPQSASGCSSGRPEVQHAVLYIVRMPKIRIARKTVSINHRRERIVSSRTVYRGPVFWVTTDHVVEPGGIKVRRDLIHHSGSVVVLAVDDSGLTPRVLLERQYRHAAADYLWELPAGRIDPGESELEAAKRELIEETGYRAKNWRRILNFYASPGFVAETMSVFLATGLREGDAQPEEDEVIYKRLFPLPTAVRMVLGGTVRDAKTISSILWLDRQSRSARRR
jgi:ADP-ribose pyrophosphatase